MMTRLQAAIDAGIEDLSYETVRNGRVASYRGRAVLSHDGERYLAIGHGPTGTPEEVYQEGYIEFVLIKKERKTK